MGVDQQDRPGGQDRQADLDTGVIVAAALHPADQGDTTTIEDTLTAAEKNLAQLSAAPTTDQPSELAADKGYHSRALLKSLDGGVWKTRIAEPKQPGFSRWHGDDKARAAVYANRTRLGSGVGKQAMRLLIGAGTPREAAARALAYLLFVYTEQTAAIILIAVSPDGFAILAMAVTADPG